MGCVMARDERTKCHKRSKRVSDGGRILNKEIIIQTHSVHQSASRCRQLRAPSRWVELSETCSTCWPDSSVRRHHSAGRRFTVVNHRALRECLTNSCLKQPSKLTAPALLLLGLNQEQLCASALAHLHRRSANFYCWGKDSSLGKIIRELQLNTFYGDLMICKAGRRTFTIYLYLQWHWVGKKSVFKFLVVACGMF